jgi:sterol desaturase/sphingolipid hydroxylase (fatty acid hydroxylase superfamily)
MPTALRRSPRTQSKPRAAATRSLPKKSRPTPEESKTEEARARCQVLPGGFAGTGPNGSFFELPGWVDKSKSPGQTSQSSTVGAPGWWVDQVTGKFLFFSPNLVWLVIALVDYFYCPYDFEAAKNFDDISWVGLRLGINTAIVFGYFGFWHIALYVWGLSKRPFNPNRVYRLDKVLHNMLYTFLGCVQYSVWEAIFMYCYATGRLPYMSDDDAFSGNKWNLFLFAFAAFSVPLVRECHFYFAHRFIHIKALYKYIHSLHHRNTDIEPFSGLCMHPVEHLYYYTSVYPSLFLFATPFMFLWNGVHLLISPAASHSGWEDHMQSDQYHYLHHRYFECNYGTSGTPLDKIFGTFRDKLQDRGTSYRGGAVDTIGKTAAKIHDSKSTLYGWPELGSSIYMALNCIIWTVLWFAFRKKYGMDLIGGESWNPHAMALLASVGPIVVAQIMANLTERTTRSILYPFHKDSWSTMNFHLLLSSLQTVVPVYIMVHMLLSPPGHAFYFWVRNIFQGV